MDCGCRGEAAKGAEARRRRRIRFSGLARPRPPMRKAKRGLRLHPSPSVRRDPPYNSIQSAHRQYYGTPDDAWISSLSKSCVCNSLHLTTCNWMTFCTVLRTKARKPTMSWRLQELCELAGHLRKPPCKGAWCLSAGVSPFVYPSVSGPVRQPLEL